MPKVWWVLWLSDISHNGLIYSINDWVNIKTILLQLNFSHLKIVFLFLSISSVYANAKHRIINNLFIHWANYHFSAFKNVWSAKVFCFFFRSLGNSFFFTFSIPNTKIGHSTASNENLFNCKILKLVKFHWAPKHWCCLCIYVTPNASRLMFTFDLCCAIRQSVLFFFFFAYNKTQQIQINKWFCYFITGYRGATWWSHNFCYISLYYRRWVIKFNRLFMSSFCISIS